MGNNLKEHGELENICIIGMGYVGLTLAVAMVEKGFRVFGVERNPIIRDFLAHGRAHFSEPGLNEAISRHVSGGRLSCSPTLPSSAAASVYIITVGTPLNSEGTVNLRDLEGVLEDVANCIQDKDAVILRSTIKCGVTRNIAKPIIDAAGCQYDLAFCPERTLEGRALQELNTLPQVVGGLNNQAMERASKIFRVLSPKIIQVGSLEEAEMVKLLNNTQRDLMFAFANEIGEMCDAMKLSATKVIRAACEDYPRSYIPSPGPVGGPCLEKDPHILAEGLREADYQPKLALAGRHLNEELPRSSINRIAQKLESVGVADLGRDSKVSILGLAFKGEPETNDLRGTMATHILGSAKARWPQASYYGFDPVVDSDKFSSMRLRVAGSLEEAFEGASLVLIQNNHRIFKNMYIEKLMAKMDSPGLVFDYWNLFDSFSLNLPEGRYYGGLGTLVSVDQVKNGFRPF